MKTTVTTNDGKEIDIKGFQKSLLDFPMSYRARMTDSGEAYLGGPCVYAHHSCGCKITGNGTLQFPLKINFCEKHSL
jgi:hypothetical protein